MHFFENAPMFSWLDYINMQYNPFQNTRAPTILPENPNMSSSKLPQTQYKLSSCMFQKSAEYQTFLETYFRSHHHDYRLQIPTDHLSNHIKTGMWKGVELRETDGRLIGLVFSKYMGYERTFQIHAGMIDYLCVHPQYRKQGLVNLLLRAMYVFCAPKYKVHFFRKEGYPIAYPPLQTTFYMRRKKRTFAPRAQIQSVPYHPRFQTIFQNTFGKDALWFEHQAPISVAIYKYNQDNPIYLAILPTYEVSPQHENCCEILAWGSETSTTNISMSYGIEAILDQLPYDLFFAPSTMPHQEFLGWESQGIVGLYAFHLHPGSPASRPVFSSLTF